MTVAGQCGKLDVVMAKAAVTQAEVPTAVIIRNAKQVNTNPSWSYTGNISTNL